MLLGGLILGELSILEIPENIGYWLVRADGGKYYDDFMLNNFIAVSDNEITLELMSKGNNETLAGLTVDTLKEIYSQTFQEWSSQQISHAVSRTYKFIFEMNVGDIVLVPSKSSKSFLLGLIASDVYEENEAILDEQKHEVKYEVNPFLKRRKVQWIKEVKRSEISEKLYWILSAHQAIFNLEENKSSIHQLLAPIYKVGKNVHGTIKVNQTAGITLEQWIELYNFVYSIKRISGDVETEVVVQSNVQSPGLIEFVSENWQAISTAVIVLSGLLFGDVEMKGAKIKGILPFFQERKKNKLEIEAKEIENRKALLELDEAEKLQDDRVELKKLELEAAKLQAKLQISSFDAGNVISNQTQMDISHDQSGE